MPEAPVILPVYRTEWQVLIAPFPHESEPYQTSVDCLNVVIFIMNMSMGMSRFSPNQRLVCAKLCALDSRVHATPPSSRLESWLCDIHDKVSGDCRAGSRRRRTPGVSRGPLRGSRLSRTSGSERRHVLGHGDEFDAIHGAGQRSEDDSGSPDNRRSAAPFVVGRYGLYAARAFSYCENHSGSRVVAMPLSAAALRMLGEFGVSRRITDSYSFG